VEKITAANYTKVRLRDRLSCASEAAQTKGFPLGGRAARRPRSQTRPSVKRDLLTAFIGRNPTGTGGSDE